MGGVIGNLRALGPLRLAALGGALVLVLALLVVMAVRSADPPLAPLFGELEARDAAAVVAALERQRVPYRLAAGGSQVLAPVEQIPRLRLSLAKEGLPAGGGVGWEIFDRGESLTTSPFQQDVNRLRALEGELSRTIRGIAGVRAARVHLVLPRREAFSRERGEAQASVVLAMQGSQRLDRDGVQAVLHLVATAVPGLKPQGISIIDSRGELLARGGQALAGQAQGLSQEELRRAQELRIGRGVEELLERSLGPGKVRAEATVEMDFDRVEIREERFDPDNQVARSQQSSSEQNRGTEPPPTTVAGNLPGTEAPPGGGTSESRQEETTNFEIGRSTRNVLREHPVVKRLSVAVLVDAVGEPQPGGAPRWRDRTPEELGRIAALVRTAIGFDERRGDRVEVVSMRFAEDAPAAAEEPGALGFVLGPTIFTRLIESALLALVALAAILVLGRPVVGRIVASLAPPAEPPAISAEGTAGEPRMAGPKAPDALAGEAGMMALPEGTMGEATVAGEQMIGLAHVQGQMRASALLKLIELVKQNPDESLGVMRRWLAPEGAS